MLGKVVSSGDAIMGPKNDENHHKECFKIEERLERKVMEQE
jgi:hypothetical protein